MGKHTGIPLPKYKSTEIVGALEIKSITTRNGSVYITAADADYGDFSVSTEYVDRLDLEIGGMFVVHEGEGISYMSKVEFDKKYKLIK
jgi:hypothetical protein